MIRLVLIDARKMEKLLFELGFKKVRQKGSHVFYRFFTGTLMVGIQRFLTIKEESWLAH